MVTDKKKVENALQSKGFELSNKGSSEFSVLYQSFTLSESCRLNSISPEGKNMNSRG